MTSSVRAIVGGVVGFLYGAGLLVILIGGEHRHVLVSRHCYIEDSDHRGRPIWQCERPDADLGPVVTSPLIISSAPFGLLVWLAEIRAVEALLGVVMILLIFLGPPLMWATIGSLVAQSGRGKSFRLVQVLVALHYVSALALVATRGTGLRGLAGNVPSYVLVWATFYLAGQAMLWGLMIRRSLVRRQE